METRIKELEEKIRFWSEELAALRADSFKPELATPVVEKYDILRFFEYSHLPQYLRAQSMPFYDLAIFVATQGEDPRETTVALRKLLEAKDAAVRSIL